MSRIPYDSLSSLDLSSSSISLLSNKALVSPSRSPKSETPFYALNPGRKTSASIIKEAKANMTRPGAFPAIDEGPTRASVKTVNTKRPFTPRQTDRRLYSGFGGLDRRRFLHWRGLRQALRRRPSVHQ